MKQLKNITAEYIIFLLILALTLLYIIYPPNQHINTSSEKPVDRLVAKSVLTLNDSIAHYLFKQKEDSIGREITEAYWKSYPGDTWMVFSLGVSNPKEKEGLYYLSLQAYNLDEGAFAYSLNDKNYLEYMVWETVSKDGSRIGHTETQETALKIIEEKENEEARVFFPVSKTTALIAQIIIFILMFIIVIGFLTIFYLPIKFLFLVSKRKAFSDEAIGILYTLSRTLLVLGAIAVLSKIIFHLIVKSQIPSQLHFSYYEAFMDKWVLFISGLVILLFAKAFLRGSMLQEEQALTI